MVDFNDAIETLELTTRIINCLKSEEIYYIRDLTKKTENEISKISNLGKISLNYLKKQLHRNNLSFGMISDDISPGEYAYLNIKKYYKKFSRELEKLSVSEQNAIKNSFLKKLDIFPKEIVIAVINDIKSRSAYKHFSKRPDLIENKCRIKWIEKLRLSSSQKKVIDPKEINAMAMFTIICDICDTPISCRKIDLRTYKVIPCSCLKKRKK